MKSNFYYTDDFKKQFKALKKKYKSIGSDFKKLYLKIQDNKELGTDLGNGLRKIRMSITAKNKGKSGGARVITKEIIVNTEEEALFVTIYDKSDISDISVKDLKTIVKNYEDNKEE